MLAIRYLRVSTDDQEGGLSMQDSVTKTIAEKQEITIVATYQDEAISGASANRAGFIALQNYIKTQANTGLSILVYDLSRIGRDPTIGEEFIQLCWKTNTGVIDRTGTRHTFESHEKRLFARIMFAFNSADKEKKNADTMAGMRNALEEGRWVFYAPTGYKYDTMFVEKIQSKRKVLIPDPTTSQIVIEALNKFASGVFTTQIEVAEYLRSNKIRIAKDRVREFLINPLYAGLLEYKKWDIGLREAVHAPLISIETHEKILTRINGDTKKIFKSSLEEDFPLRRFVKCEKCDHYFTACWVTGRQKRYKSYFCQNKKCSDFKKHYNGDKLEEQFIELLKGLKPDEFILDTAKEVFEAQWEYHQEKLEKTRQNGLIEVKKLNNQIDRLFSKLKETESELIASKYESEIEKLEEEKVKLAKSLKQISDDQIIDQTTYLTLVHRAFSILTNPVNIWVNGSLKMKRLIFDIVFEEYVIANAEKKYLTPKNSLFYQAISDISDKNSKWWTSAGVISNTSSIQQKLIDLILSIKIKIDSVEKTEWEAIIV